MSTRNVNACQYKSLDARVCQLGKGKVRTQARAMCVVCYRRSFTVLCVRACECVQAAITFLRVPSYAKVSAGPCAPAPTMQNQSNAHPYHTRPLCYCCLTACGFEPHTHTHTRIQTPHRDSDELMKRDICAQEKPIIIYTFDHSLNVFAARRASASKVLSGWSAREI